MNFILPGAFFLAILLPVIIAMYLLKLRRTELVVSSTFLWRQMVRDVEANAPWQRLKKNWLLILQLLFLIFLILSLARPFTWESGFTGKTSIMVIDTSASMAAIDVSPSRIEAAKDEAHRIVDGLADGARVTVITAGDGAQTIVSSSADRREIHQGIDRIQAGTGISDLSLALQLASAIAARQPETEIVVISDGRVTLPGQLDVQGHLRYVPIGINGENQSISMLTLYPTSSGESISAFTQIVNHGDAPAVRRVAIYADSVLVNVHELELLPGTERSILTTGIPPSTEIVEAFLRRDDQTVDNLTLDDRSFAVHRRSGPVQITLVSEGNLFLETALSLLPNIEMTRLDSIESNSQLPSDLTIFDSTAPVTGNLPQGNIFFINPPNSTEFFDVHGILETPIPLPADPIDPILENVLLDEVNILEAVQIELPEWSRPIVISDPTSQGTGTSFPLLFIGENGDRRISVLAFDLHQSDIALQPAFPLLISNLIDWYTQGMSDIPTQVNPGEPVTFHLSLDDTQGRETDINITRPDGSKAMIEVENGLAVFAGTNQLGLYRIDWGGDDRYYLSVNLYSPGESQNKPADALPISGSSSQITASTDQFRREWWRIAAIIALILLVIEWFVYQRAAIFMVLNRIVELSQGRRHA